MDYNLKQAAVVTCNTSQELEIRDDTGNVIFRQKMTFEEVEQELEALQTTGFFLRLDTRKLLVNLHKVGAISCSDKQIVAIENFEREKIISFQAQDTEEIRKTLNELPLSKAFFKVPRYDRVFNYRIIQGIFLNKNKEIEITLSAGNNFVCKNVKMSSTIAEAIIRPVRTAIEIHRELAKNLPEKNSGIDPAQIPDEAESERLQNLSSAIKESIFGQDEPVDLVVEAILRAKAGLKEENKPVGSFLFLGPTGVGKTESARKIAEAMGMQFKKIDMSEYMEKVAVSRLIGGSPNYVGYNEGGELTNFIKKHPRSVILLDEIEKAHLDVVNILLQVLDDAQLTDGQANVVKFNESIIIMTSNLGSRETQRKMGFGSKDFAMVAQNGDPRSDKSVQNYFLPEFVNRVSEVVRFSPLTPEMMIPMVEKFISNLKKRSATRNVTLDVTTSAREYFANKGYNTVFGARPLSRLIDKELVTPLARAILFGELTKGGEAIVDSDPDNGLKFIFNGRASGVDSTAGIANDNQTTMAIVRKDVSPK